MMTILQSYGENLTIALIGASGGIGQAMLQQLLDSPNVDRVYSFCRQPLEGGPRHTPGIIDIADDDSVAAAAQSLTGVSLDLVLVTTGLLHGDQLQPEKSIRQLHGDQLQPEKSIRQLDGDSFQQLMTINSLGPMLVAQHFLPLMPRKKRSAFAAISARVGSIGDNRLGGWYSYRASKAALNMMLRCLSIETRIRYPQLIIAGLHPGTVETGLSEPFRRNVKPEKLFSLQQSAAYLLEVLEGLDEKDSGSVFAWDGQRVPE